MPEWIDTLSYGSVLAEILSPETRPVMLTTRKLSDTFSTSLPVLGLLESFERVLELESHRPYLLSYTEVVLRPFCSRREISSFSLFSFFFLFAFSSFLFFFFFFFSFSLLRHERSREGDHISRSRLEGPRRAICGG